MYNMDASAIKLPAGNSEGSDVVVPRPTKDDHYVDLSV